MPLPRLITTVTGGAATVFLVQVALQTVLGSARLVSVLPAQLQLSNAAIASPNYVPRSGDTPRRTNGTGARGCTNSLPSNPESRPVLTLISVNQIESATLERPTFLWNLSSDSPTPVEFTLVDTMNHETVVSQQFPQAKAGITAAEIPQDKSGLLLGRKYRWSVALICNPTRRSSDVIAQGYIQRVEPSTTLTQQLQSASWVEQAELYAKNGFLMDSLTAYWQALHPPNSNSAAIKQDFLSLLDQIKLTDVAQQAQQRLSQGVVHP
jgi:hypothetical protein